MKLKQGIFILLIISEIQSFNTKLFCIKQKVVEKKCTVQKCPTYLFSFECGSCYCSISEKACQSIINIKYIIRAYSGLILFEKELGQYYDMIKSIRNCSKEA